MGPDDDKEDEDDDDEDDDDDDDDEDDDEKEETFGLRGIGSSASAGLSANALIASAVSCADDNAANVDMAC
jgi:hypothetical protein